QTFRVVRMRRSLIPNVVASALALSVAAVVEAAGFPELLRLHPARPPALAAGVVVAVSHLLAAIVGGADTRRIVALVGAGAPVVDFCAGLGGQEDSQGGAEELHFCLFCNKGSRNNVSGVAIYQL